MKSNYLKSIQLNLNETKQKTDKTAMRPKLNLSNLKERQNDSNMNDSNRK